MNGFFNKNTGRSSLTYLLEFWRPHARSIERIACYFQIDRQAFNRGQVG